MENAKTLSQLMEVVEQELMRNGCRPGTINVYKVTWRRLTKYAGNAGVENFTETLGRDFLKTEFGWPDPDGNDRRANAAARAVRVLGDYQLHGYILRGKGIVIKEWEKHFKGEMENFKEHLAGKGLSKGSVFRAEQVIQKLFTHLVSQGLADCGVLDPSHIEGFVKTLSGYAKKTLAISTYSLRLFITYLGETGRPNTGLEKKVPSLRYVNRRNIPSTWTRDETERILEAVDTENPCGKRDYAILLMIARLGLRQSDIVNLTFESFDWAKGVLTLTQMKTRKPLTLPLPVDVGEAVIDYLRNGRPESGESFVFLKHKYPFGQMNCVYMLMDKHIIRAGLERRKGEHKGPHSLRHSLAGRMLENRTPIETISAVLGHSSVNSTLDYLKIDIGALLECALDPEGVLGDE
jgi:integrase